MHGETHARDLVLRRQIERRTVQRMALRHENLRAHQVDARNDFRDSVLDLDARVHLDEEPFAAFDIVKKFDRARVVVADLLRQPRRGRAQFLAHLFVEPDARRDLDDFLVSPLHRAIAFVQVQHLAVAVAEHLHLDVLGVRDVFFEKHRGIAERAARLVARLVQQVGEVAGLVDDAHAASTATERRLDDEREADLLRDLQSLAALFDGIFRAGQGGDFQLLRQRTRGDLVAHQAQQFGTGPDEYDARFLARFGEVRVL